MLYKRTVVILVASSLVKVNKNRQASFTVEYYNVIISKQFNINKILIEKLVEYQSNYKYLLPVTMDTLSSSS